MKKTAFLLNSPTLPDLSIHPYINKVCRVAFFIKHLNTDAMFLFICYKELILSEKEMNAFLILDTQGNIDKMIYYPEL